MKLFVQGQWRETDKKLTVSSPFDGSPVDSVSVAGENEIEKALESSLAGASVMKSLPSWRRAEILLKTSSLLMTRAEEFANLITREEGKPIHESRGEVARAVETLKLSGEEAKRLVGESFPMDCSPGGEGKFGFTLRVPCGVVVAISPFNFPLNLVCHKVGPALAAGNAVIIKPASRTPLSALKLVEILLEAGLPPLALSCLVASGEKSGLQLCSDPRVRKITFTGSAAVGEKITRVAGVKRLTMELGSNSPLIILEDADLEKAATVTAATGYSNAGQVCISTQRILVAKKIYDDFLERLKQAVSKITVGDPRKESTRMGPMIDESEAIRVLSWMKEACDSGARMISGGSKDGSLMEPAILADVSPQMRVCTDELFGPAVAVYPVSGLEDAIKSVNASRFGLAAGIFTRDVEKAFRAASETECGNIHINWAPGWRLDFMPYGGMKMSGTGKEGPKYALQEMTENKMVVLHF